jgi:threonine/homoserine/homoserine lactone efflux protein
MHFLSPIWYGWLLGVGISIVLFGPAFFLLVNTSIRDGFSRGVLLSLGVFISDLVLVLLIHFGLSNFYDSVLFKVVFSFIAGIAMLIWGYKTIKGKYRNFLAEMHVQSSKKGSLLKGFLMNILNPFAFVLWTTTLANLSSHYEPTEPDYKLKVAIAAISMLFGLLSMDVIKSFTFHRVGKYIPNRWFFRVQFIIGLILLIAGGYFMFHGVNMMMADA